MIWWSTTQVLSRTATDALGQSDAVGRLPAGFIRAAIDSLRLRSSRYDPPQPGVLNRSVADGLLSVDAPVRAVSLARAVSDARNADSIPVRSQVLARSIAQAMSRSDVAVGTVSQASSIRAFPGAQGFGAGATGGRGGTVYKVTNLNDSGAGSLRTALTASGARIVLFDIGGTINLSSSIAITSGNLTVAGQTAPGGGITVAGARVSIEASNVILRGVRFRNGTASLTTSRWDCISIFGPAPESPGTDITDIIIDHCSTSWGIDDNLSTNGHIDRVTLSWNIIAECLHVAQHDEGPHSMGTLLGGNANNISVHHNISAHNDQRNFRVQGQSVLEVVNNVVYDWGSWGMQISEVPATYVNPGQNPHVNIIRNYYKAGPDSNINRAIRIATGTFTETAIFYFEGNFTPQRTSAGQAEWLAATDGASAPTLQKFTPWAVSTDYPVTADAYPGFTTDVLALAGAPNRDSVDTRIAADVSAGTGSIIDNQAEVGGFPSLAAGSPRTDTNGDGVPDDWATANGMGAAGPWDTSPDGWPWIEKYVNSYIP